MYPLASAGKATIVAGKTEVEIKTLL